MLWKDYLNIIEFDFSGITDTQLEEIKLYPNPASSFINFNLETFTSKTNLLVYNTIGSLVLEKELVDKDNNLDISFLPNGIYIIYTTDNNGVVKGISRFMKK